MPPDEITKKPRTTGAIVVFDPRLGHGIETVANVSENVEADVEEMLAAATNVSDTLADMRERPSKGRKTISAYIANRLTEENERGYVARVARATGFTTTTVSTVKNGKKDVGEDFELAMARFWGIEGKIARIAEEWQSGKQPSSAVAATVDPLVELITKGKRESDVESLRIARSLIDEKIRSIDAAKLEAAKRDTGPHLPTGGVTLEAHKRAASATKKSRKTRPNR